MTPAGYDVVVVGAGPAGSAAARAAAQLGARTLLLERAALPRYKRCGGGLVALSAESAGVDVAGLARDEVSTLTVTQRLGRSWTRRSRDTLMAMVSRADLDHAMAVAAQQAGAQLRTGALVMGATEDADGVELALRESGPIRARCVVAADGVSSRLAAAAGVRIGQQDLGLEGEFRAPPGWSHRAWLDWGPVPGSYGWLFPKGDTVTVGVIGDRTQSAALRRYYADVVAHLRLGAPLLEGGHHTRVRTADSPLASAGGRILLVGDAAGWLEPWTREGISFGLRSGRLAGEAAAQGVWGSYPRRVQAALGAEVAAGGELLAAFALFPGVFHLALASPPGWREFKAVLAGRTSLAGLRARAPVRLAARLLG